MAATEASSGQEHSFTRARAGTQDDPSQQEVPASKDSILGHHAQQWLPLWQDTTRAIIDLVQKLNDLGIRLPPLTVEQLDAAARTYKAKIGTGLDCVNPGPMSGCRSA